MMLQVKGKKEEKHCMNSRISVGYLATVVGPLICTRNRGEALNSPVNL